MGFGHVWLYWLVGAEPSLLVEPEPVFLVGLDSGAQFVYRVGAQFIRDTPGPVSLLSVLYVIRYHAMFHSR